MLLNSRRNETAARLHGFDGGPQVGGNRPLEHERIRAQLEFQFTVDSCKEGLPVINLESGCENKCASPYIGERFGKNSVGGK
jgi:hypothetical protein